jgi:hypothetical protein
MLLERRGCRREYIVGEKMLSSRLVGSKQPFNLDTGNVKRSQGKEDRWLVG